MKNNEVTSSSVNLFPIMALSLLTLVGTIAAIVMLVGLHNKIQKSPSVATTVSVDEIGDIKLDNNFVRINLMKRNTNGKIDKLQEIAIPLENFTAGFQQQEKFMNQMIEKEIISRQ